MRAEYDSEADALSIDLTDAQRWDGAERVDDDYCNVALAGGRPANVELLAPREHLELRVTAAERYHLDAQALQAAAQPALAAPDRTILLDVRAPA
jgi:uncharacterized protein YuzE